MFPSRPDIELLVPPEILLGQPNRFGAVVRAEKPVSINHIEIALVGQQYVICGHCTKLVPRSRKPDFEVDEKVADPGTLPAGEHRYECSFDLPAAACPTYISEYSYFDWKLRCRIDIPHWPDAKAEVRVRVRPHPQPRPVPQSIALASPRNPRAPYVEATLEDRVFGRGDVIRGSFAIGNLHGEPPVEVTYALTRNESTVPLRPGMFREHMSHRQHTARRFVAPSEALEGVPIPIAIEVPDFLTPSLKPDKYVEIDHCVSIIVRSRGGEMFLGLPIALQALEGAQPEGREIAIGEMRWRDVWGEAARDGLALAPERLALEGRIGEVDVELAPAEDGSLTIAITLRWERWGLDLEMRPRRISKGFSRKARDRAQAEPVIALLDPIIEKLERTSLDDRGLRTRIEVKGFEPMAIEGAASHAVALAKAIDAVGSQIPPPPALRDSIDAWRSFARAVDGRLIAGAMAIEIESPETTARILTRFDGKDPIGTRLEACFHPPLEHAPDPQLGADLRSHGALTLNESAIVLDLDRVLEDPASIRGIFDRVRAIAHTLQFGAIGGPFR